MVSFLSTQPDFSPLAEVTVLPNTTIDQAVRRCETITDEDQQWDCYLRSLAFAGVRHWLESGSIPITLQFDDHPPAPPSCVQVNGIRLGVAISSSLPPEAIAIPQSALQGHDSINLWLLVAVQEELGQIHILSGLDYRHIPARATAINAGGDVVLPLSAFTLPPDRVLFYLHHLPTLHTQSELPHRPSVIGQAVINTGRWFSHQLDEVAQQWGWRLLEPLTPISDLRYSRRSSVAPLPIQELESILHDVAPQGVTVPTNARAAFTEVAILPSEFASVPLRLYALTWSLLETETPEWSLLVFLRPAPDATLPPGLRLRIRDDASVLVDERFEADAEVMVLYGQVLGHWDETFTVELVLPDATAPFILPTFSFQPDVS